MWPAINAVAGTYDRWTIRYTATESFAKDGGMVTIEIPVGWSAPQVSDSTAPGFLGVTIADVDDLDSLRVSGRTARVYLASRPGRFFNPGEYFELIYGSSYTFARTQTAAPDTVEFTVASDPYGFAPVPLASGSPSVRVVPGPVARIAIFRGAAEAGAISLTADDSTTLFSARGLDSYGNVVGGAACTWGLTAPLGVLSGGKDSTNTLDARRVGSGYITAYDDFAHSDSTGLITVTHGAYARLDLAQPDSVVAGDSFTVSVAALDADGNKITSGASSGSTLELSVWLDSLAVEAAHGTLSVAILGLVAGQGSVAELYTVSESVFVRAVDVSDPTKSDFGPRPTLVKPAPPVVAELEPDTLDLTAGAQAAFSLTSSDVHGNRSPVASAQTFYLWKNSASGQFRQHGGGQQIFEVVLPADSSVVWFDYYDTKSVTCQVAAMDVDANFPAFPPATAVAVVTHGPTDTLLVSGVSDPLTAGGQSDVAVEAKDAFGNRVTDYSGEIEFASSDVGSGTALPADYGFAPADSGRHVFPLSVTLTKAGEQWLRAFDKSAPSVDGAQAGITVVPAACDTLVLSVSENPVSADSWLDLEVEALDDYGNPAAGYAGVVRFTSSDTGDSTVLPGDYRFVPADNGLHVFAGAARLTQAGAHSISVADTSASGPDGAVTGISVLAGTARSVVLFPSGSFQVNAGGTQVLKATARDAFGNPRPGEPTSVVIRDTPDGALEDDPANPNNTSGGVTIQAGNTDSAGEITVLYRAPELAGLTDTVDAYCATVGHGSVADVGILSTPAGATALRILPGAPLADTAGAVFPVAVEAMDSFGNLDGSKTSLVRVTASSPAARLSVDGGVTWSAGNSDSLALVAGSTQARLKLVDTKTGDIDLLAEDAGKVLISALKNNVTIAHALPAGATLVSIDRDTLIADGNSVVAASAGPFRDAYGNSVGAGELVTVSSQLSDVVAADVDTSAVGLQLATGGDGRVSFSVRAATGAGVDTVTVRSAAGTARGFVRLTLLDGPSIEYVAGSLAPYSFSPGQTVALSLALRNNGGARVYLLPASSLSLGDGNDGTFTAVLSDTVIVPAGGTAAANFAATPVPSQLDPGAYSPLVNLLGLDQTGRAYAHTLSPGPNTIQVVSMNVVSILAPLTVERGTDSVAVEMAVKNGGDVPLEVAALGLDFSSPGHTYALDGATLPDTLTGGETRVFTFLVDVDASAPLGDCTIDGFGSGVAAGTAVSDAHASSPAVWNVQSRASLAYVTGSLYRSTVSQGQTLSFSILLENFGTAAVQLDTTGTSLRFGPAGSEYAASLPAPMLLPGGASTAILFEPARVGMDVPLGAHRVQVCLAGIENAAPFADTLWTDPDSVTVTVPGDLRISSTTAVSPNVPFVDASQAFSVEVEVENLGDEDALDVLVSLSSSGGSAVGVPVNFGEIAGGTRKKLAFNVSASSAPGPDILTSVVESATGELSGLPLSVGGALDDTAAVLIQTPALLTVSASVSEPAGAVDGTVSTDQTLKLTAVAQNLGQGALASGGMLTLAPPAGFTLLSPASQVFALGTEVEWTLKTPSAPQAAANALVWISSLPPALNTGGPADSSAASPTAILATVRKTELSLDASIVAPEDATDGSLRLDTEFTVQAVASNLGIAAATGTGRLTLALPSGYSFPAGQAAEQEFTTGSPVTWNVVSPSASTPIQYINIVISQPPLDENAGAAASVVVGTRNIAVYAEAKHMVAEALGLVQAPDQVAAGDDAVQMMLVRIANPDELGEGSTIGLRALTVYVRGADDGRLSDPASAVAGVSVWRYSNGSPVAALGASSAVSANPVRVTFSPVADTLGPGEADTLIIMINVAPDARAEGIALELDGEAAFEAFDRSSGELIPVMAPDGTDFPNVLSAPSRLFTGVHNYPNPFRAGYESTTISYYLANDSRVSLKIFTLDGKPVISQTYSAEDPQGRRGLREIEWDGRNGDGRVVLNGVYICKLEAPGTNATFKIAVAK